MLEKGADGFSKDIFGYAFAYLERHFVPAVFYLSVVAVVVVVYSTCFFSRQEKIMVPMSFLDMPFGTLTLGSTAGFCIYIPI